MPVRALVRCMFKYSLKEERVTGKMGHRHGEIRVEFEFAGFGPALRFLIQ